MDSAGGVSLALDLAIDAGLAREGLAREVVNRVQALRKELDLELDERIALRLAAGGELARAVREHWPSIRSEVLAQEDLPDLGTAPRGGIELRVGDDILVLAIERTGARPR